MKHVIIFLLSVIFIQHSLAQNEINCNSIYKGNFKKTEKAIKKQIRKYRNGTSYFNGEGSGNQITFQYSYDSIINWLKRQDCVADAFYDKCMMKSAIYPGSTTIGVRFITTNGAAEQCFHIREGKTGQLDIFGWRPKMLQAKNVLVYKSMNSCPGFIDGQKFYCSQYVVQQQYKDSIIPQALLGIWESVKSADGGPTDKIEFRFLHSDFVLVSRDGFAYYFSSFISGEAVSAVGVMTNWPPYDCYVKQLEQDKIKVEYKSFGVEPVTIMYQRGQGSEK